MIVLLMLFIFQFIYLSTGSSRTPVIGLCLLTPSAIYIFRTSFFKWHLLILTFIILGVALIFRSLDYSTPNAFPELIPQGTQFLWHITSALAVFSLGFYFKYIRDKELLAKVQFNQIPD